MPDTLTCLHCGQESAAEHQFCSRCGSSLTPQDLDQTIDAPAPAGSGSSREPGGSAGTPGAGAGSARSGLGAGGGSVHASSVSRISSVESGEVARFGPGSVFAERYRIIGLLGRGGMGEVYRADDLTLDQPVALKFLPESLAQDADRLARFYGEVRIARRVAHPNVCRVYDIGQADGLHYISMEFVDGEDLSLLLRRIGRLPSDKGLEIARQLCAGLAAAHDQGVLHRDLKPANVMIDGAGKVRITDFGLAILGEREGHEARAGTPAYMAPEQLSGEKVTGQSDVYSLGLVLYEMFTGKPAFSASSVAEFSRLHAETSPASLSSILPDMDPAIERVIMRCLEKDPTERPRSSLAVAAALPGGDPLAAALQAGEIPDPELVAAAGEAGAVSAPVGWTLFGAAIILLALFAFLNRDAQLYRLVDARTPPVVLADRARGLLDSVGYTDAPADRARGWSIDAPLVRSILLGPATPDRWDRLVTARPSSLRFWYRESAQDLDPVNVTGVTGFNDPPMMLSGMRRVRLDEDGRLISLEAVPPQVPDSVTVPALSVDWSTLFLAAGLDPSSFTDAESSWLPGAYADTRRAWEGTYPEQPDVTVRVEAASFQGRPVQFEVVAPWSLPGRMAPPASPRRFEASQIITVIIILMAMIGGGWVARRNLKLGRGDRRGATRLAGVVLVSHLLVWVLEANHSGSLMGILQSFILALGQALFWWGFLWVMYIAMEPYVRRRWPHRIVSWSRLLTGRWTDPLVGRDVLVGALFGLGAALLAMAHILLPPKLGIPGEIPLTNTLAALVSLNRLLAELISIVPSTLFNALILFLLPIVLLVVVRRPWIAVLIFFLLLTAIFALRSTYQPTGLVVGVLSAGAWTFLMLRFGLLALATSFLFFFVTITMPILLDFSTWYAVGSIVPMAILILVLAFAFRSALGGRIGFGTDPLHD